MGWTPRFAYSENVHNLPKWILPKKLFKEGTIKNEQNKDWEYQYLNWKNRKYMILENKSFQMRVFTMAPFTQNASFSSDVLLSTQLEWLLIGNEITKFHQDKSCLDVVAKSIIQVPGKAPETMAGNTNRLRISEQQSKLKENLPPLLSVEDVSFC